MQNPVTYFFSDYNLKRQSVVFKKLLWLFLIIKCFYWLTYFELLFGENSVVVLKDFDIGFIKGLAFFLNRPAYSHLSLWAIILLAFLCFLSLFNLKIQYITDFLIWIIVVNLHNRIYPALTGGDYLLNQFLFYSIFIHTTFNQEKNIKSQLKTCVHNFGVIAVMLQVCFIYFASGVLKLYDESWMNGEAVAMISQVDHYNLSLHSRFLKNSRIAMSLNYLVLFYQILFPVIIWFKQIKKPLIILGVLIHLYIAFVMGLMSFGIIMLIAYVYFWPAPNKLVETNLSKEDPAK